MQLVVSERRQFLFVSTAGPNVVLDRNQSFHLRSSPAGPCQYEIRIRIQLRPAPLGGQRCRRSGAGLGIRPGFPEAP